jgi:hypothetical protein
MRPADGLAPVVVSGLCVAAFWLLALGINRILADSTLDPIAGVVAGVLVAIPVYRAVRRISR